MKVGVLGAGPAAAAAALALARAGVDVTVFKPARPGEKPCGGAVPEHLLDELEGFDATGLSAVVVRRALLENAASGVVQVDLTGLRIYRRSEFDAALLEAARSAGADLVAAKAGRLAASGGSVRVEADSRGIDFDWVVGGDGAHGLSRRAMNLDVGELSIGLGATLIGVEVDTMVLGFPGMGDAYSWVFPRPGGSSVGIAFSPGRLSDGAARHALELFVRRHLHRPMEDLQGVRYRYPIPVYSADTYDSTRRAADGRVLLVGDAAGVADPLTREGIRYAVRSGRLAADCLIEERPGEYPRRLEAMLRGEMRRARRATELFYDDPVGQWMVPVCRVHPGVRRVLEDLLSCRQPYRGLRRRLLRSAVDVWPPLQTP